jgi:LuxR family maltose regulon positive regulatory protein
VPCVNAYAAARRGAFDESHLASEHGTRLLDSMNEAVPRAGIHCRLVLADAACLRRDYTQAETYLAEAEGLLPAEPDVEVLISWIDHLREVTSKAQRPHGDGFSLTEAEFRVLEQLPTHRSLEEIGEHLYVSRNTVKSHTVSIYRKLGVSRRSAAVERARELGLTDSLP